MKTKITTLMLFLTVSLQMADAQNNKNLDKNKVKARIQTVNDKFWNTSTNAQAYEVPAGSGKHTAFANSIWIGGLDQGGQLHLAANTYKQSGTDFWPGPLDTANISSYTASNSATYNRLWKIDCKDIDDFVYAFNAGSVTANTYTVPDDILNYPAKGIANFQKNLSPFMDNNNNGTYSPLSEGDYPLIRGHQQILSIYNDQRGNHSESGALSMGVEIHEIAYAYSDPLINDTMQAINYTTFHRYEIYNRSATSYHDVYVTDWNDVDLGYFLDDYIGCDTINQFSYCYNANAVDPAGFGMMGYGNKPPVSSHALLAGNCDSDGIDNNQNAVIDEPGEQFLMNLVTYYNNNFNTFPPATTNPGVAVNYYNFMAGYWKDNTPFTAGGTGYGGTVPAGRVYPGDPALNTGWTEASAGNPAGDRRILMTSGPFNLPAGSKIEWGYAIVFSQDTGQAVNTILEFKPRVQRDVKNIRYYDSTHAGPQCTPAVNNGVGLRKNILESHVLLYPNPARDQLTVDLSQNVKYAVLSVHDVLGRKVSETEITNGYRARIDTGDLQKGVYFVEIKTGDSASIYKFVKN